MRKQISIERKLEIVSYIVANKDTTATDVAKHFDTTRDSVWRYVNSVKIVNPVLGKEAAEILRINGNTKKNHGSKEEKEEKALEYARYIIRNKCSYKECSEHFKKSKTLARKYVTSLEGSYPEMYKKASAIAIEAARLTKKEAAKKASAVAQAINREKGFSTNPEKQVEVANWAIKNKATLQETAEHFEKQEKTIRLLINNLQSENLSLYKQLKEVMKVSANDARGYRKNHDAEKKETEKMEKALKNTARMLWFKKNLKKGDIVNCKVVTEVEKERADGTITTLEQEITTRVTVKDVFPNYFIAYKYGTCYYAKCVSMVAV